MTSPKQASTKPERSRRLARAMVYYAAYIVLGLAVSAIGPTLPGLADQTSSTLSQISIIFSGNSLGYIAGSLLGGWTFDRRKGHPVLVGTLVLLSLVLFTLPLAPSLGLLVTIGLLLGFGMGILDVGGNTLIVWLFGREVGPYMNALHLSFGIGAFLSPLLIDRVVVATGGIRGAYWILAALVVPVIFWMARVPSPPRPGDGGDRKGNPPLRPYRALILMVAILFFLHVGVELGFGGWIFSYAVATRIGPDTIARLLNSTFWGALTLGRLVSIPLAVKIRPKTMLLLDLLGAAASIGLLLLLPDWSPAVWIGTFGLGFSIASMFPATLNFAERRMPITGSVTAILLVGANAGSMTLPWLIGQLFETVGPGSMMVTLEISVVLALLVFGGISLYTRRSTRSSP